MAMLTQLQLVTNDLLWLWIGCFPMQPCAVTGNGLAAGQDCRKSGALLQKLSSCRALLCLDTALPRCTVGSVESKACPVQGLHK